MQGTIKTIYGGSIMRTIEYKIIEALNGGNGVKNLSCRDCVEVDGGTKNIIYGTVCCFGTTRKIFIIFQHADGTLKQQKAD